MSNPAPTRDASSKHPETRQLCGLDLIRFAAALLVMVHHFGFWASTVVPATRPAFTRLAPYTWSGWIGVEIFFVLSGFVIAYSAQRATALTFVVSRVVRLYPAAWICATLTVVFLLLTHDLPLARITFYTWFNTILLLPHGPLIDSVYWTLRVEMIFYLFVFLTLLTRTFQHIGMFVALLGACSSAGWIYATALSGTAPAASLGRHVVKFFSAPPFSDFLLVRFAPFFAIGVLLWLCLLRRATPARLLAIVVCSIGAMLEIRFRAQWIVHNSGLPLSIWLPLSVWLAALAAIIVSVKGNVSFSRFLGPSGVAATRTVGLMTYPLYLIHASPGYVLIRMLHGRIPDYVSALFALILAVAASYVINRYLERPVQKQFAAIFRRTQLRANPAPVPASTLP